MILDKKPTAVIYMAHCYPNGLVYHMAYLARELILLTKNGGPETFVCSTEQEQFKGSWEMLRKDVPASDILIVTDYDEDIESKIGELFKQYQRVLVHFGGGHHQLRPFARLRKKFGKRLILVATTHSFQVDSWRRIPVSCLQFLLYVKYVDHVIFQSPYTLRMFTGGKWLMRHNKASIIPLGVEPFAEEGFKQNPGHELGQPDIRELLCAKDLFKLVYLAAFRPGKGHVWLVKNLGPILKQKPHIKILMLGNGMTHSIIVKLIKKLGLSEQIICPGYIQRADIPWVLHHCNAALVVSRAETFGHCYVEPAMAGLPIIGTRVGAGEYLIQDMETGIGFSMGDADRFSHAVEYLSSHCDEARSMGDQLCKLAHALYFHNDVAASHLRLYMQLLEDRCG